VEADAHGTDATRGIRMFFLELEGERPRSVVNAQAPITRWTTSSSLHQIPNAPPRSTARGSGSTWRSTARTRVGTADVLPLRRRHRRGDVEAGKVDETKPDRLRGICWRVADIDATHARLAAAGADVSEVRIGRKPGRG
jgi:hypothetical protein